MVAEIAEAELDAVHGRIAGRFARSCKRNSEVVLSWLSVGDTARFGTYLACSTTQRADERGRSVWRSIGMSIYDAVG
jgi:hypothetical protein